jgi:hypothetical protein
MPTLILCYTFNINKMKNLKNNRGFIQIVLVVVGALVLLKYVYNIDVVGFLTQGRPKELLDQFYNLGNKGWQKYDSVIIKIWNYFILFAKDLIAKIK